MSKIRGLSEKQTLQVACLCNIIDIQKKCQAENLRLSSETNNYLMYLTLRKLGPFAAQKLVSKLVERGEMKWDGGEDFDVEAIVDHRQDDEAKVFYFIKWRGWSIAHNTWEPRENLNCVELVEAYHESVKVGRKRKRHLKDGDSVPNKKKRVLDDLFKRISKSSEHMSPLHLVKVSNEIANTSVLNKINGSWKHKRRVANSLDKRSNFYKDKKRETQRLLKEWEKSINAIHADPAPLFVENAVDLEGPPDDFTYIADYLPSPDIVISDDPVVFCSCEDCSAKSGDCCADGQGAKFAYTKNGRVRLPIGTPIYECNKLCNCGAECINRVVQKGRKIKLCIFRTSNGSGWGVKTLQRIRKGTFIMEYIGEIVTFDEAERRGMSYDAEGRTYLFDLDYNEDDSPYTVDAGVYGNVAHFVNHSCDPNLVVYGVWVNCLDPRLPKICLFAKRDIAKGEELNFDYMMTGATTSDSMMASPSSHAPSETVGHVTAGHVTTGHVTAGHVTAGHVTAGHVTAGHVTAGHVTAGHVKEVGVGDVSKASLKPVGTASLKPVGTVTAGHGGPVGTASKVPKQEPNIITDAKIKLKSEPMLSDAATGNPTKLDILEYKVKTDLLESDHTPGSLPDILEGSQAVTSTPSKANQPNRNKKRTDKYRIACQCGSAKCRGYLF